MSTVTDNLWQEDKHGHVLSSKKFTQRGIFQLGEVFTVSNTYTTMEHNHSACIERSWKVRRSQCMCVMSGLERRISLTLRNDYGNNMIICLLSLSSFFLTANPCCCEMGEDFSKCFRDNLLVAWMDLLCTLLSFTCSSILCFLHDGELKDKVKSSSWEKVPRGWK